jgi:hypothetical protein
VCTNLNFVGVVVFEKRRFKEKYTFEKPLHNDRRKFFCPEK